MRNKLIPLFKYSLNYTVHFRFFTNNYQNVLFPPFSFGFGDSRVEKFVQNFYSLLHSYI